MKYIIKKTTQQAAKNKTEILTISRDIFIKNLKEYYNKETAGITWAEVLSDICLMEYLAGVFRGGLSVDMKTTGGRISYGVLFN